jgi:hypothetical protein
LVGVGVWVGVGVRVGVCVGVGVAVSVAVGVAVAVDVAVGGRAVPVFEGWGLGVNVEAVVGRATMAEASIPDRSNNAKAITTNQPKMATMINFSMVLAVSL